jgi:homoserine kinase
MPAANKMDEQIEKKVTIKVPASSANIGPGFDTVGLALSLYATFTFSILTKDQPASKLTIEKGEGLDAVNPDDNLAFQVFKDLWHGDKSVLSRLHLKISTDIPMGRGLGSSSTAVLAGVCAARALSDRSFDKSAMLSEACRYEGHADNLSASLYGGLTLCGSGTERRVIVQRMQWPESWKTSIIVPHRPLLTKKARAVLPKRIPLSDAISNIQNVALFLAAVQKQDAKLASRTLFDKLHEPYRSALVPELGSLQRGLRQAPIIGCVLSGAGSSILIIYEERHTDEVTRRLRDWQNGYEEESDLLNLSVDEQGMTCETAAGV